MWRAYYYICGKIVCMDLLLFWLYDSRNRGSERLGLHVGYPLKMKTEDEGGFKRFVDIYRIGSRQSTRESACGDHFVSG